jgi:hypothetical protein
MGKLLFCTVLLSWGFLGLAQSLPSAPNAPTTQSLPPAPDSRPCDIGSLMVCVKHVAEDEKGIVLSPLHAPAEDLLWIVPFGAATGVSIHYDTEAIHRARTTSISFQTTQVFTLLLRRRALDMERVRYGTTIT